MLVGVGPRRFVAPQVLEPMDQCQYLVGSAQKARKDYPAAQAAFAAVLTRYATTRFAAYAQEGLAWCHFEQKAWEPALEAFRKVTATYASTPPAAEAALRIGDCLFHLKRYPAAAAAYEPIAADKDGKWAEEALYWLGVSYELVPETGKAREAFTRLAREYRQSAHLTDAYLHLGALELAAGRAPEAVAAYQQAETAASSPTSPASSPTARQEAALALAWARYQSDKSEARLAEVEKALGPGASSASAAELGYRVAWAHFEAARYPQALARLEGVIDRRMREDHVGQFLHADFLMQHGAGGRDHLGGIVPDHVHTQKRSVLAVADHADEPLAVVGSQRLAQEREREMSHRNRQALLRRLFAGHAHCADLRECIDAGWNGRGEVGGMAKRVLYGRDPLGAGSMSQQAPSVHIADRSGIVGQLVGKQRNPLERILV